MGAFGSVQWNQGLFGGPGGSVSAGTLVSDLIYVALRLAGVLTVPGRQYGQAEQADAFNALNAMLDTWATERLMVPYIIRSVQTLSAGKQDYTIGISNTATPADFVMVRPSRIEAASILNMTNPASPLELPMDSLTVERWQGTALKTVTSSIPPKFYYEAAYPLGILHLLHIPAVANSVALYIWSVVPQFQTPNDTVLLPPGYLRALQYNLAVELAVRFPGARMKQATEDIAVSSKAAIKSLNSPILEMRCDPAVLSGGGTFDILIGE